MKIRNGFVSNSSSSSFIIEKNDKTGNLKEFVLSIIDCIGEKKTADKFKENLEKVAKLDTFDSVCFDDVHIKDVGDVYLVLDNESYIDFNFYDLETSSESDSLYDEALEDVVVEDSVYNIDDILENMPWCYESHYLNFGIYGRETEEEFNYCDHCSEYLLLYDGYYQCPVCKRDKEGSLRHVILDKRKEILNKFK